MVSIVREYGEQYCWSVWAYVVDHGIVYHVNASRAGAYHDLCRTLDAMGILDKCDTRN